MPFMADSTIVYSDKTDMKPSGTGHHFRRPQQLIRHLNPIHIRSNKQLITQIPEPRSLSHENKVCKGTNGHRDRTKRRALNEVRYRFKYPQVLAHTLIGEGAVIEHDATFMRD